MKTLIISSLIVITKVFGCFGNGHWDSNKYPHLNPDSTQIESTVRFELKNFPTPYIILRYSLNYLTYSTDTLAVSNGVCEKKYHFAKPISMEVIINGIQRKIFIAPRHQLTVVIDKNNTKDGIIFFDYFGIGKIANDYLGNINISRNLPTLRNIGKTITEEEYLEKIESHYKKLDSVYSVYENLSNSQPDESIKSFFKTQKTELAYHKLGRLINFINARNYKADKAVQFFNKYIQPASLLKEEIDLNSGSSVLFFSSYLPDYILARVRESKDNALYHKIGHYAYLLDYVSNNYDGEKRNYAITNNLYFLASVARNYPPNYPSVDSLITLYDSYLSEERRTLIRQRYYTEIDPNSTRYTDKDFIDEFKISTPSNHEYVLNKKLTPVTVIDLWASWCGNCIDTFPLIESLMTNYSTEKKVSFLKISLDDKEENWRKSTNKLQLKPEDSYWIVGGMKSEFAKKFDVKYLPRYIILNQEGKILKMYAPDVRNIKEFTTLIDKLIQEN
ncbi:thiol-disulfide isomerase/thioredoxin [Runella defluvii]|uniref:Thiol-disulfide isomerase/thioredoxin n=1 Tax=Runella defluvii TaxID=370973 RepID=A0A7W5ZPR3_9BACT|nr:TlpA disulfide reductase family protein [Runella defluvii]MBB3839771.1 thiol-disulfide isomerase/thioredoxin [Runella defluvii]